MVLLQGQMLSSIAMRRRCSRATWWISSAGITMVAFFSFSPILLHSSIDFLCISQDMEKNVEYNMTSQLHASTARCRSSLFFFFWCYRVQNLYFTDLNLSVGNTLSEVLSVENMVFLHTPTSLKSLLITVPLRVVSSCQAFKDCLACHMVDLHTSTVTHSVWNLGLVTSTSLIQRWFQDSW